MIEKIFILHETSMPRHFLAIEYLRQKGTVRAIEFGELDIFKQVAKGIILRKKEQLRKACHNMVFIFRLLFMKGQKIIVAVAPFNMIVPLLLWLKMRNEVIYFTSWPYWDGNYCPHKIFFPFQKKCWYDFIKGLKSVAVTKFAGDELAHRGAHVKHIPHAVDTKLFRPCLKKNLSGVTKVIYVGHLVHKKGIDLLLKVICENSWNNVEFWFVGKGKFARDIKQLAEKYPVRHLAYIEDQKCLAEIYTQADIFILPSRKTKTWEELFGIVIIEAMACGLPVIATDSVGPREIIKHGKTGYLIQEENTQQLKEKLNELINSPETRVRMGQEGHRRVDAYYDVEFVARKWEEFLSD